MRARHRYTLSERNTRRRTSWGGALALTLLLLLLAGAVSVSAQTGGSYDLSWWTVDGGGAAIHGGDYALMGTAGQADAGPALSGGGYTLVGGFWSGGGAVVHGLYLPLIMRN